MPETLSRAVAVLIGPVRTRVRVEACWADVGWIGDVGWASRSREALFGLHSFSVSRAQKPKPPQVGQVLGQFSGTLFIRFKL